MFRDLQKGYPVSILDKSNNSLIYKVGTVISVSPPRIENRQGIPQYAERVIDLTIEADGATCTYVVPESGNIASAPNITISCDATMIANEVKTLMKRSQDILASIESNEAMIRTCEDILERIEPAYASGKAQDERLSKLENAMSGMNDTLEKILGMLSSLKKKSE